MPEGMVQRTELELRSDRFRQRGWSIDVAELAPQHARNQRRWRSAPSLTGKVGAPSIVGSHSSYLVRE